MKTIGFNIGENWCYKVGSLGGRLEAGLGKQRGSAKWVTNRSEDGDWLGDVVGGHETGKEEEEEEPAEHADTCGPGQPGQDEYQH